MAFNLNTGQAVYQKTEIFDTAGNHTWTHPLPGQNIEVFVELYGGGGGSQFTSGVASSGTASVWDTSGTAVTVSGGAGASFTGGTNGLSGAGLYSSDNNGDTAAETTMLSNGSNYYGSTIVAGNGGLIGNVGDVKRFNVIANNDINLTVGGGGIGNNGDGKAGACVVSYNVTTTQTPVIANLQRRDWEHFGEISWRTVESASAQSITANTVTTLTLDNENLDTGNKVSVSANVMTLEAGTYEYNIEVPTSGDANDHTIRLYNQSDSQLISSKKIVYYATAGRSTDSGGFTGVFNLSSQTNIRLEIVTAGGPASIGRSASHNVTTGDTVDRTKFQFKWRP